MDIKTVNDYKRPSTSVMEFPSKKEEDLPYGDIILVEKPGDVPETILKHSVGICGRNLKWTYTKLDNSCGYTIYINSNKVAFASDCDKQFAKNAASAIALDRLRKYYHTIKVKQNLNTQTNATLTTIKETKSQNVIHNDNAQKLMKLIGWSCEYLRNSEQGIMEPVMFEQLTRKDLGLKSCPSSPSNICELKAKCKIIFKKLLMGDIQNDIVFSMDFTNKEKEKMLQIARSMCLKSYIDCSSDQWKLVILHKVNIQSLLEKLKSLAGTTKTYELIQPTGLDDELDIVDGTIEKYESIESTSLDEKVKDPEHSIEKYESIKPTSLVEDTRCIAQTSIITEKAITNKINKKLKSEIEETETLNNDKKCSNSIMESLCKKKNLYGDIILVEKPGDVPEIILKHSVGTSNKNLKCEYTKIYNSWNYVVSINSKQVACASDCSRKRAKKAVLALALDELRKYYYTIKIKQNSDAQMNITLMTIKKLKSENIIPDDNIGKKLLKLMGWSGGGLGKSQQGIMEPVMFVQHFGRKGLGLKSSSSNIEYQELKAQCKIIFQKLLMGDIQKDIVFSTDFTNDEKTVIDEVARLMALKSRSHGPSDQRKLVISRKINIRTLFQELKSGRSNEKYELIEPTHLDDELDSVNGTTENYELTESTSLDAEVKDFEGTTEKYRESIEPTNLVEELDQST